MKYIIKNPSPAPFETWKRTNPHARYDGLIDPIKSEVRNSLKNEQHGICCYCECRLYDDFHIEHFKPKGLPEFVSLQLDYNNLHACCMKVPSGSSEKHCGHKKGNTWDDLLISPLELDCESHFSYTLDGEIHETDERGKRTIQILNLNCELLKASRASLLKFFQELPEEDKEQEINTHIDNGAEVFGEYYTMIKFLRDSI